MEGNYLANQIELLQKRLKLVKRKEKKERIEAEVEKKIEKIIKIEKEIEIRIIIIKEELDQKKLIFAIIVEKKDIGQMSVMKIEEIGKYIYK